MTEIGSNIINEYFILKNIFSYLLPQDLLSASLVCKEWRSVAKRVLQEYGGPVAYTWEIATRTPDFNRQILPKIILHFHTSNPKHTETSARSRKGKKTTSKDKGIPTFLKSLKKNYPVHYKLYTISNCYFFASEFIKNSDQIETKLGTQENSLESVLLLNDKPGCKIKPFEINSLENFRIETIENIISRETKAILFIVRPISAVIGSLHKLFPGLERLGAPLAGGICCSLHSVETKQHNVVDILGLTFEGENVSSHSALHKLRDDLDEFLQKFAQDVGPLPEDSIRMAFLFICIDRIDVFGIDHEYKTFRKHFPNVPVLGYFSMGEFYLSGQEYLTVPAKRIRSDSYTKWLYHQCTTYLVVTIKHKKV